MESSPLSPTKVDRRRRLTRHFMETLEPLLASGEHYADFSVERLLTEARISRSSFYGYFTDKADLLEAMAEDIQAALVEAGQSWWQFPADGTREDLRAALIPSINIHRKHHTIFGALAEAADYDERIRTRYQALIGWIIDRLEEHIRAAQAAGTATQDLDPRATAEWLIWMMERGLYQLVGPATDKHVEHLVDTIATILWNTLYALCRDPSPVLGRPPTHVSQAAE